ncbi:hypothetical protein H112_05052 [Trichophyton rubrum D6]|uniref:RED-like N-terminal domain-containing protein n=4 Tax=Trichophyton TaxID=5550 RepID=A0A178EPW7_TRIRU|nr:hypothetical protein H100_05075 [Trichophyton rubrum MR850]EZF41049.1 hypothetical protein H102_05061 [Trichophyton rubrum CBS 100081]EZF51555.1 hypothetical protein H103_05063 [Trichophyton rubrum CBS 288.86]EZF62300.1 hypothetical protein H104_05056 [Trichophyton rubrum CBS 289.86]EZF72799.1 hypothetical protein H105_05082 [Trichophyton soudanense CBS 452.61]EZF83515.1 hypothetical protein H110_05062 [Trichophyton rubrum MR1448]EZF94162.1 hypothetical protein H113_05101 [Trichophyton rub
MNNEQFRRLLFDNKTGSSGPADITAKKASSGDNAAAKGRSGALGSRMRSSIPMTPRAVSGVDFARQLAEHRRDSQDQPPSKKFKSSTGPKGFKYAPGYEDRASLRRRNDGKETDDREERVRGLEEMLKLGQIDQSTFDKLGAEIGAGGDISSTHLIKGLDWQLLKRVKAGEDITAKSQDPTLETPNDDDEFERILEEKEKDKVESVEIRGKEKKKGNLAPLAQVGSKKMTRDEILKQLKASRLAQSAQPEPSLGSKFKKIGSTESKKKRWVETDASGRRKEILVITDADGKTKRKIRWLDKQDAAGAHLLSVDKNAKPLGMDVPAEVLARIKPTDALEAEDDEDIFAGVGDDYNPLANAAEDESTSSEEESDKKDASPPKELPSGSAVGIHDQNKPSSTLRRDYFATGKAKQQREPSEQESTDRSNPLMSDPTIREALRKAATIRTQEPISDDDTNDVDKRSAEKQKSFLEEAKRREMEDALDMDMGFGDSRFGEDDEEEFLPRGSSQNKRKRGPKKKKGDKNNVSDVLSILQGRGNG